MFLRQISEFLYINILNILDQLTLVPTEKEVLDVLFFIVSSIQQYSKTSLIYESILHFQTIYVGNLKGIGSVFLTAF